MVASELDASFPGAALISRVRALIPHAEVELLKETKHCPPLSDEFRGWMAARMERFLEEDVAVEK